MRLPAKFQVREGDFCIVSSTLLVLDKVVFFGVQGSMIPKNLRLPRGLLSDAKLAGVGIHSNSTCNWTQIKNRAA